MNEILFSEVEKDDDDIRLDRWFKRHCSHINHGMLQKLLRKGQVRVDDKKAKANQRIKEGQTIKYPYVAEGEKRKPKPKTRFSDEDFAAIREMVLYKDDAVIVLNKPAGLAVQGGSGTHKHIDGMLGGLVYDGSRPKLVHRLDKDTSGVLVLGRTSSAAAKLADIFRSREAEKTYWALVLGEPPWKEGEINAPLLKKEGSKGESVVVDENGKKALTSFVLVDSAAGKISWVKLNLHTGRTHQLRVHCSHMNMPIIGDGKYGGKETFLSGVSNKLHLHARNIKAPHPDGGLIDVTAPLSKHMKNSFDFFGFSEKDGDMF